MTDIEGVVAILCIAFYLLGLSVQIISTEFYDKGRVGE